MMSNGFSAIVEQLPEILEAHGIDPQEVASLIHGPDAGGK